MAKSVRHLGYSDRLHHLKLPSLLYHLHRGDMITVYQLIHGGMDIPTTREVPINKHLKADQGALMEAPQAKGQVPHQEKCIQPMFSE